MSCSVIIKTEDGKERRVYVDSEEELKNMTVKEFRRRVCPPEDKRSRCCLFYTHKQAEDEQTRGDRNRLLFSDKRLEDDQTLGSYGIREGSTILEIEEGPVFYCIHFDYEDGVPRTGSMEKVADMQQTESISRSCIIQ